MNLAFNIYSITLISLGLITALLALIVFKRVGKAIHSFGYIMLAISWWAVAYGFELSSQSLPQMLFWVKLEYFSISYLPAFWIIFILNFIGKDSWLRWPALVAIFALPTVTLAMVWTNDLHHLHYTVAYMDANAPFPMLGFVTGPWYKVHTAFFYFMLLLGLYFLVSKFRNSDPIFRKQNNVLLIAALVPWVINVTYVFGFKPFGHLDLTPFGFIITSMIIGIGLLRFRLFDIRPVAREKIIEAMQEGMLVLDRKHRVIDANGRVREMLHNYHGNLIGANLSELQLTEIDFDKFLEEHENDRIEIKLEENNETHYFSVTTTSLYDRQTVYSGHILLFRDITERKKSEERLSSLNDLKDKLFSIIAHDLRSPLMTLMSVVSMNELGILTEAEVREMLPDISKNLGYTTNLVDNLLQWSKSQLQGEVVEPRLFNIYKTAQDTVELLHRSVNEKGITIINGLEPETIVYADENMIQAVIRNLVSNAVKFSGQDCTITISSSFSEKGFTTMCIKDTGIGIAPENLNKLFGIENFTTRGTQDEKGTGLGLVLCRDFVEKNGGKIWAESTMGAGSKFCFTLPDHMPGTNANASLPTATLHILV